MEKRNTAQFYYELSNLIHEDRKNKGTELLESYFAQNSAQLNPELSGNKYETCTRCRLHQNWIVEDIPFVIKGQAKRQKQIQKLRKMKTRNSKQANLLKKLLDRKSGYQKLTCKLCGYITKKPVASEIKNKIKVTKENLQQKPTVSIKQKILETQTPKKKRTKSKTAGLNPLYVKHKEKPLELKSNQNKNIFDQSKKLEKLSNMLKHSETEKSQNKNKINLLMQL